jgi:hypothetical protein
MTVRKYRRVHKGTHFPFGASMGTNTQEHYVEKKPGKFTLQVLERQTERKLEETER